MVKPVKWPGNFSGLRPRRRLGLEILVACEGRASGVSCRVRRPFGQLYTKVAVFALPTDATDTKGDFEGETASIAASFDFHPLKTRELSQIPAR